MEKINIAEILRNCPQGMELDCVIYDDVTLECVSDDNCYPIKIHTPEYNILLNKYGCLTPSRHSKCVIFPKGKTSWEGFVSPREFKDGDILATDLGSVFYLNTRLNTDECYGCYVGISGGPFHICEPFANKECCRFATEEEKQKLFDAIKANGYKWDEETRTLEKLIEPKPKFKVGDRIKYRSGEIVYRVVQITEDTYVLDNLCSIPIWMEHMYNLVPDKFDINSLIPFESKVLVRDTNSQDWTGSFYSHYNIKDQYPFYCINYGRFKQCIPYEGNEHLLGKTDDCSEFYKNW